MSRPRAEKPPSRLDQDYALASGLVLLQRRMNQLERRVEQVAEDMVTMIEDLKDQVGRWGVTDHGQG